jgi:TRAP-type mannitol/chloroaromatic compound transport system permease small subunit
MLLKLERGFDKFADAIGYFTAFVMVLMILNVTYDVVMRYFFNTGSLAMQELEWHLFSVIILLGISYTLKEDGHVRVDLIYDRLTQKKKAKINMVGSAIFIIPVALLIGIESIPYVVESFNSNEISPDPGGLEYRWIVKSLIPLSFFLLIITAIGFFIKNLNVYKGLHGSDEYNLKGEIENLKNELNQHKHHVVDMDGKGEDK